MNWYKANISLAGGSDERILMRVLGVNPNEALGIINRWFSYINAQTTDGRTRLLPEELDSVMQCTLEDVSTNVLTHVSTHVFHALQECGWVGLDERGEVVALEFETYNSSSAKRKADQSRNAEKSMQKKRAAARGERVSTNVQTTVSTNVQQIRGDNNIKENGSKEPKESGSLVEDAMRPMADDCGRREHPRPSSADDVDAYLATLAGLKLTPEQRMDCAKAYYLEMEAVQWVDKSGRNVWRWKPHAASYAARWSDNLNRVQNYGKPACRPSRNTRTANDGSHEAYNEL